MFLRIVNHDTTDKAGQVDNVDGWHEILTFSNVGKIGWVLDPCLLEVVVEDALSVSVPDSRAEHVDA